MKITSTRTLRNNILKTATAEAHHDILYILYVVFHKRALSEIFYLTLKKTNLVKDYKAYKRMLRDLEETALIKRTTVECYKNKQEEVVLRQFAIDYMAKALNESPVAVPKTITDAATIQRAAKALFLLQFREKHIATSGIDDWKKIKETSTCFIAPNKTNEWLAWFERYLNSFEKVPQIAENFANLKAFYAEQAQKFNGYLKIGSKSSHNKGLKENAIVDDKTTMIEDDVQKQTKGNLLDNVTLYKVLSNNIYLFGKRKSPEASTGKEPSPMGFKVVILDIRDDATLHSYLLKLAYVYQFITEELLLNEFDVLFDVDFVTLDTPQAESLKRLMNELKTEDLERYGIAYPHFIGNIQIKIESINLLESLQK